MRVDPQFALAVTFLTVAGEPDADGNAVALPVGTAFLVGEPLGATGRRAPWLVTARHVVDNTAAHEQLFFRVAKDDGTTVVKSAPHAHWVRHPSSDVAMVRLQLGFQTEQFKWIPLELLIDETAESDGTIGIGDDTFMLTVLPRHPGLERDRPIARFGHISKIATEPVELWAGPNYPATNLSKAFLVEATTWPTNSGAPVFVHYQQRLDADASQGLVTVADAAPRLLGLCAGHYAVPAVVKLGPEEGAIALHSGISVVTPASAILEITRRPEHVEWREAEIARLSAAVDRTEPAVDDRALGVTFGRRALQLVGVVAILAGAVFALQGMALLPSRIMYGKPEWVVIGAVLVVSGVVLLWRARGAS